MGKGEDTKNLILQRAAQLLNQRGFLSASVSEIMAATGLQKGGIYNHFKSREDLALQAFDYAVEQISTAYARAIRENETATDRLLAVIAVFRNSIDDPAMEGGCPVMNCAIESDDNNPALRQRVREVMDQWRNMLVRIISKGIAGGEFRSTVHPDSVATLFIASLEGAIMLSNLYKDPIHMKRVLEHQDAYIRNELKA